MLPRLGSSLVALVALVTLVVTGVVLATASVARAGTTIHVHGSAKLDPHATRESGLAVL